MASISPRFFQAERPQRAEPLSAYETMKRILLTLSLMLPLHAGASAIVRSSNSLTATFTADGRLAALDNKLTRERFEMADGFPFAFTTETSEVNERNSKLVSVQALADGLEVAYRHAEFDVNVRWRLGGGDHFLEKRVRIRHLGSQEFAIKRFSVGGWRSNPKTGKLVPFQHGQCLTYFLRQAKGGFFFGVRTPFEEMQPAGAATMDLAYPVNMVFNAGDTYEAETAYWGVYRRTGREAPPAPPKIKESVLSSIPPDTGESEAMLAMVRKLKPPREGITLVYNGYQGGLYLGDYGDPDGDARAQQDIATLSVAKEMLGKCIIQPAAPFFGAHREALRLTPQDQRLIEPPARRRVLDWINGNGLTVMNWASLKAVHGWLRPRLGPYSPNFPEWQANPAINCTANPAYLDWFTRIVINDSKTGFAGFISDEPPPGLRYRLVCEKPNHRHLAGDVSYAYFYRRREMFRQMRETFGAAFELQGQRPHMDAGIWDATYLDSLFTFLENPGLGADKFRLWSRMRRAYTFVPSYLDQIMVQPGFEPVDYTMLSALAVSSNYLFIAPSTREKLADHAKAILGNNRVMANGLAAFPAADRARVRFWLDWARDHGRFMADVIDLADWPDSGKPDGHLRVRDGHGYAFLFNPSSDAGSMTIPLNETTGFTRGRTYRLKWVHPSVSETTQAKEAVTVPLKPHSANLVQIEPR